MLKIFAPVFLAGLALAASPCGAAPESMPQKGCPASSGTFDKQAYMEALKKCPGFKNDAEREQMANAMADAIKNNSAIHLQGAPVVVPTPGKPAGEQMGRPAPDKGADTMAARVDARMKAIVDALQTNKLTADKLISAAREAGATPSAISDLEKMSAAFRQVFMTAVPPQQLVESILTQQKKEPQGPATLLLTAPDGSVWIVTPQMQPPLPPQNEPRKRQPHAAPQADPGPVPGVKLPPSGVLQDPALRAAPIQTPQPTMQNAPAVQPMPEMVIIKEEEVLPYWPAKEHLGRDGLLNYMERRVQSQNR